MGQWHMYVRETDIPVGGNGRILSSDSGRAHVKSWHSRKGKTSALARNSAEIERCVYPCVSHNFGPVLKHMTHPRLSQDQTLRLIGSEKIWERWQPLQLRLHWFETEVLSQDENLKGLSRINQEFPAKWRPWIHASGWCWIWTEATRSLLYWRQLPHMGAKACRNVNHHMFME